MGSSGMCRGVSGVELPPGEERCRWQGCKGCVTQWAKLELGILGGLRCSGKLLVL